MNKARGRPSDRVPSLKPLRPMPPNPASKDLMAAPTTPSPAEGFFPHGAMLRKERRQGPPQRPGRERAYCQTLGATASPHPVSIDSGSARATRFKTARAFSL